MRFPYKLANFDNVDFKIWLKYKVFLILSDGALFTAVA